MLYANRFRSTHNADGTYQLHCVLGLRRACQQYLTVLPARVVFAVSNAGPRRIVCRE